MRTTLVAAAGAAALVAAVAAPAAAAGKPTTISNGQAIVACTAGWNQYTVDGATGDPILGPGDLKALAREYYALKNLSATKAASYLRANSDGTAAGIRTLCYNTHQAMHTAP